MNPSTPPKPRLLAEMGHHIVVSILATLILAVIVSGIYPLVVYGLAQALFHHQANGSLIKRDGTATDDESQAVGSSLIGQTFSSAQYFHPRPSAAGGGYDPTESGGTNLGPLSDKLLNGLTTPATTQPTTQPESVSYDGVRLRTIHYAVDNAIPFKLYDAKYVKHDDGSTTLEKMDQVALSQFQNKDGSLNDVALIDAFPHAAGADGPDYTMTVLVADDFAQKIPADAVTSSASGLDPHITPYNASLQKFRVAAARGITSDQVQTLIDQCTDKPDLGILGDPGVNVLRLNIALDVKYPIQTATTASNPATQPTTQPSK